MNDAFLKESINWNKFENWFNKYSSKVFDLEYSEFDDTGRGLKATKIIKTNDPIVSVPKPCLINYESIVTNELNGKVNKLTSHQLISLYVLIQLHLNESSEWKAYLNTLPKEFPFHRGLIGNWEKFESYLPLDFKEQFQVIMSKLKKDYEIVNEFAKDNSDIIKLLLKNDEQLFNSFKLNYIEFEWSWLIVNTRCIYLVGYEFPLSMRDKELMTLAPGLDLLNHSPLAKTKTQFNKIKNCLEIINMSDSYEIDEEVFITYGSHDNNFLLAEYGFLISNNPHDYWKIDLYLNSIINDLLDTNSNDYKEKIEFLKLRKLSDNFYLDLNNELDFNLLNYLRYLLLPKNCDKFVIFEKFLNYEIEEFEGNLSYLQGELKNIVNKLIKLLKSEVEDKLFIINTKLFEFKDSNKRENGDILVVIDYLIILWTARYNICNSGFEI